MYGGEKYIGSFLSTPSVRRATTTAGGQPTKPSHFYPRPPRGGRPVSGFACSRSSEFLSTPSARRATTNRMPLRFSTTISIHALREEGDCPSHRPAAARRHFYPRPPRGGRLRVAVNAKQHNTISIHALREEGDCIAAADGLPMVYFYPRPPRGGRLINPQIGFGIRQISIHALREEGDLPWTHSRPPVLYFYPRPPRGGRLLRRIRSVSSPTHFYPRPPRGGRRSKRAGSST